MKDLLGRTVDYFRVSVTDRCNLRCVYCMPAKGAAFLPPEALLSLDEILRAVSCAARLGIRAVRLTGGEPMARPGCLSLVRRLKQAEGIRRVAMTSNGLLLRGRMAEAAAAGLDALNLSLDTLDPALYAHITRGGDVRLALDALHEALDCGLRVRINAVPIRGFTGLSSRNPSETAGNAPGDDGSPAGPADGSPADGGSLAGILALAALARDLPVDVRFIELMPVGCGREAVRVPMDEVHRALEGAFGPLRPDPAPHGMGPAAYFRPVGFTGSIGLIGAVSHAFCARCNRLRLTPDGLLKPCLNHPPAADLRAMMRAGCTDDDLAEVIRRAILQKPPDHGFASHIESRRMNQIGG